jgi:hypothetical protein
MSDVVTYHKQCRPDGSETEMVIRADGTGETTETAADGTETRFVLVNGVWQPAP